MTKLENLERAILIFLISALVLGLGLSAARKFRHPAVVTVESFDAERYKNAPDDSSSFGGKVNINTAGVSDLAKIRGIGPALAGRIVEYRDLNGDFSSTDDIKRVKGVGVALFEKIRTKITTE